MGHKEITLYLYGLGKMLTAFSDQGHLCKVMNAVQGSFGVIRQQGKSGY